jgi:hypothetical protein
MVFWQLTVDSNDPETLSSFWEQALGYRRTPPDADTTWWAHYRAEVGGADGFPDRLFDPAGKGPALWFQQVPETKAGKNRLHIDLYPTGRDDGLPQEERIRVVEARVAELVDLGATVQRRTREDDREQPGYYVVMNDPEGNEFCVS